MGVATYNLILNTVDLPPRTHDERVIGCDDADQVHALPSDLLNLLDVAREMTDLD